MTWKQTLLTGLLSAMALAGCMAGPAEETGAPDSSPRDDGSGGAVPSDFMGGAALSGEASGTRVLHYRTDTGDFTEPVSPATAPLQAFVVENGARRYLTMVDPGDGTFRVPDAPVGSFFLQQGGFYIFTDARSLSLDRYELGRRGRVTDASQPLVKLSLSNLSPLEEGYPVTLDAVSSNANAWASIYGLTSVPAGTTSVTSYDAEWYDNINGSTAIVDGTKGDLLYLRQTVQRSAGPLTYTSVDRVLSVPPFTLSTNAAAPSTLSGTFQTVPQRSARVQWWRSTFDVWRLAVHPQSTPAIGTVYVSPLPWGNDAWYGYMGDLVTGTVPASSQDLDLTFDYGNPHLSWGTALSVSQRFSLPLRLPGTTSGTLTVSHSETRVLKDDLGPLTPRISPPQALTVDGANAQVDRALASLTPTISWSAPRVGTASAYRVRVYRLYTLSSSPTITRYSNVANFHTAATSLKLPPAILLANERYLITVSAYFTPGVDYARQPYVLEVLADAAYATSSSSILTAPAGFTGTRAPENDPRLEEAPESKDDPKFLNPKAQLGL